MSHFVVSALKFRPTRFDEVIGQAHVTDTLKNALIKEKVAHAFLFCGPRGVGKTSCARILAKAVNCENPGADREPCNACPTCVAFNDNGSFNIFELDAASNNGVEHIRALVEQVAVQPPHGKKKIFIIDEVHMLSAAAFNAFLKTLEEPPPYAIFILATTEKHKLLPTILSRCQVYDFKRIDLNDIVTHLKTICDQQQIAYEEEALFVIAEKADGALRDALSIFDRINSGAEAKISYNSVIETLGILDFDAYFNLVNSLLSENVSESLLLFEDVLNRGHDGEQFLLGLAKHVRDLMFFKYQGLEPLVRLPEAIITRYKEQAKMCSKFFIVNCLNTINDSLTNMPLAINKRLHQEIVLTKLAYLHRLKTSGSQLDVEKKNSTSKIASTPASAPIKKPTETKNEKKAEIKVEPSTPDVSENTIVPESKKEAEKPIDVGQAKDLSKISKPAARISLAGGLSALKKKISEKKKEKNDFLTFDKNGVDVFWKEFTEQGLSGYYQQLFKTVLINIKNDALEIVVQNENTKDILNSDFKFSHLLRTRLNRPKLEIKWRVETKVQEEKKRLISNKDKYEHMLEQNPKIDKLRIELGLTFDG